FIFLILMLMVAGEAIYFKGLEVRYTRSKSRKFLIARNSIRRSGVIIVIAAVCAVLLFIPFTHEYITEIHHPSDDAAGLQANSTGSFSFESQDMLGFCRAGTVTVTSVDALSLTDEDNIWVPSFGPIEDFELGSYSSTFRTFTVTVENPTTNNISYTWEVGSEVSPILTFYIPIIGFLFMIVEMVSISVMLPIRERYATSSIYSKRYVAETKKGEYILSERPTKAEVMESELLEKTLDLPPPPPAKPKPQAMPLAPLPPEKKEMARKKGVVDEGLIEEPDISCPGCGEMNSPHASMCFACGSPLVAGPADIIDLSTLIEKGQSFSKAGKYDDAINCFDEVLKHDKTNHLALMEKGAALHGQGKWGQAVQYVNTALQLNPRNLKALLLKAVILEDRGRMGQAIEVYKDVLEIEPDNRTAKRKLATIKEDVELDDVEEVLEQFICIPGVGFTRATALYEHGYTSMGALMSASDAQLARVKGISERLAKRIKRHLNSLR
ncbi:MAG: tetratricopeptide repeat protein, partial [Thermoplasmata archaeon]|nr:tetratricopeptide repeat protein [Thermoplasmata archaeon]